VGVSTGSSLIGAYGFGLEALDLSASDKVFDLDNTLNQAPNYVTFTVAGLVVGDRVLVTNDDTGIDYSQMIHTAVINGAAVTSIVSDTAIPTDTPATGTIRVERTDGTYSRHAYTSWTGSTFTIASTDFSTNNAPAGGDICISYLDLAATGTSESFTTVYDADRTLFIRVRDGGGTPIKPFETTGTLASSGGSTTAIRTSDS
jgi:Flp pilus assembly protein TadG